MKILALDTATEACSVALDIDGRILDRYEEIERGHAERLLPLIDAVLAEGGIALGALDAIAFGRGPGGPGKGFGLDAVASALGMTVDELRTALSNGQSIADVAKSKNVDLSKVTDALVAAYTKHEQDEVTAGTETQAQADKEIAAFKDRVDDFVNGSFRGRPGPRGEAPPTTNP